MGLRAIPPAWYCGLSTTQRPRERGAPFRTPLAHGQRRRVLCHLAWRGRREPVLSLPGYPVRPRWRHSRAPGSRGARPPAIAPPLLRSLRGVSDGALLEGNGRPDACPTSIERSPVSTAASTSSTRPRTRSSTPRRALRPSRSAARAAAPAGAPRERRMAGTSAPSAARVAMSEATTGRCASTSQSSARVAGTRRRFPSGRAWTVRSTARTASASSGGKGPETTRRSETRWPRKPIVRS